MDTRRMSGSEATGSAPQPVAVAGETEIELIELSAVARRRNRLVAPSILLLAVTLLIGLIAYVGLPSRTDFSLTNSVPNLLQHNAAP